MLEHERGDLLFHPLARELLNAKWNTLAVHIELLGLFIYVLFVANFTKLMMCFRYVNLTTGQYETNDDYMCQSHVMQIQSITAGCLAGLWLLGHVYRFLVERWNYLDTTSTFEVCTFACTLVTSLLGLIPDQRGNQFSWGIISLLLAFVTLLFFTQSVFNAGIYVSMMFVVLKTVLKVMVVFAPLLMGFALVFKLLLYNEAQQTKPIAGNSTLTIQHPFETLDLSVLKVIAMTIGELEYTRFFVEQSNGDMQFLLQIIFLCFCVYMAIVLMNLLIGLAVGDIESVRKNAELKLLAIEIDCIYTLDHQLPTVLLRRFHKKSVVKFPNCRKKCSIFMRLKGFGEKLVFGSDQELLEEAEKAEEETKENLLTNNLSTRVHEQEAKMDRLLEEIEGQRAVLEKISEALNNRDSKL